MGLGLVSSKTLLAIANAIRSRNGHDGTYAPSGFAAAVAALDGTSEGTVASYGHDPETVGYVDDSVFSALADAIRAQNGSTERYTPLQMPAAIEALEFSSEPRPRALLLSDGTLEMTFLPTAASPSGGTVSKSWDLATGGYAKSSERPWYSSRAKVTRAVVDGSIADAGIASCARWFHSCQNLVEVRGFENLSGATDFEQMFVSCGSLESIFATSFDSSGKSADMAFNGCGRLVGASGVVPANDAGASVLDLDFGVLTNPDKDLRTWAHGRLVDGSVLEVSASEEGSGSGDYLGRVCVGATYQGQLGIAWYGSRSSIQKVRVLDDMAGLGVPVHMRYWFYGLSEATSFEGLSNLAGVCDMYKAFSGCTSLAELDLRGFDTGSLMLAGYLFSGCSALTTILADPDWELVDGAAGSQAFYGCKSLVGGNGTKWSSSNAGLEYFRIDKDGQAGYLTAG